MKDNNRIKENILDFTLLRSSHKERQRLSALKETLKDEMVNQAKRAQADIDKVYDLRSKELVRRLRKEVLSQLISEDKKR